MNIVISNHVLCIILTMVVAGYKNRSLLGWFIAALFLNWIAFIIVLLLPRQYYGRW